MVAKTIPIPAGERSSSARPLAVIDIGSTSIRMAVAEIDDAGRVRTLEALSQAVSLGRDTFTHGTISRATIEQCVHVLASYRKKLEEYQIVRPDQIRVVATSAVREAQNRLAFMDRIYIATGLEVDPIDEAEVNRITYLGIQPFLRSEPGMATAKTIIVEVGGGATEVLLVRKGNVTFSHVYRLGSLRLRRTLETHRAPAIKVRAMMESQIQRTAQQVRGHIKPEGKIQMIAIGGDVRFATKALKPGLAANAMAQIPVPQLAAFTDTILELSPDEIVRKYHLSFPDAETVGPALLAYVSLAREFQLDNVMVTNTNLRDGLLSELAAKDAWTDEFRKQIIRSALDLGKKFDFEERHARHVAELCRLLFRQLPNLHQLDTRYDTILYVSALLHEIGAYISNQSLHKHSLYLIRNSELFGLGKRHLLLVALVARYHRRALPSPQHEGYATLSREERVVVSKMAAMLRVAVALDESRSQRIKDLQATVDDGRLIIAVPNVEDLSHEQLALKQSGLMFEEVFGMPVVLQTVRELGDMVQR